MPEGTGWKYINPQFFFQEVNHNKLNVTIYQPTQFFFHKVNQNKLNGTLKIS